MMAAMQIKRGLFSIHLRRSSGQIFSEDFHGAHVRVERTVINKLVLTSVGFASTLMGRLLNFHLSLGPSSRLIMELPNFTRWCSLRARQPKNIVLLNHMVGKRLCGEWSSNCFAVNKS